MGYVAKAKADHELYRCAYQPIHTHITRICIAYPAVVCTSIYIPHRGAIQGASNKVFRNAIVNSVTKTCDHIQSYFLKFGDNRISELQLEVPKFNLKLSCLWFLIWSSNTQFFVPTSSWGSQLQLEVRFRNLMIHAHPMVCLDMHITLYKVNYDR